MAKTLQIINVDQGSDEWFELRAARLTASHAQAIAANGAGLKTYVRIKMSEYYSCAEKEYFSNADTERGNALENEAGLLYAWENDVEVSKVGFVVYNDYVGCSPDLLVNDNGLAEIKCPADKTYFNYLMDKKIDSKYMWQMQAQLLICGKEWCDYVVYNPNFETNIVVQRVFPDKDKFEKLEKGFESGQKMIEEIKGLMK